MSFAMPRSMVSAWRATLVANILATKALPACGDLRITDEPRADHAQYLASWLSS
jgi:hypothetical protein